MNRCLVVFLVGIVGYVSACLRGGSGENVIDILDFQDWGGDLEGKTDSSLKSFHDGEWDRVLQYDYEGEEGQNQDPPTTQRTPPRTPAPKPAAKPKAKPGDPDWVNPFRHFNSQG